MISCLIELLKEQISIRLHRVSQNTFFKYFGDLINDETLWTITRCDIWHIIPILFLIFFKILLSQLDREACFLFLFLEFKLLPLLNILFTFILKQFLMYTFIASTDKAAILGPSIAIKHNGIKPRLRHRANTRLPW